MNPQTQKILDEFVSAVRSAFGDDLVSVVLFGSAAEDRLRPSSDLNVLVLLRSFDPVKGRDLGGSLQLFAAAARLRAMFLQESELGAAAQAFPVKFADMRRRHQILAGTDPFPSLAIPRDAAISRLKQVLLNLALRLRARLVESGQQEERLARAIAEAAGPLRASAAELLELEGRGAASPKAALELVAGRPLVELTEAREKGTLAPGVATTTLLGLVDLAAAMRKRAEALR
jgi:predicted nucleotidyltransferase